MADAYFRSGLVWENKTHYERFGDRVENLCGPGDVVQWKKNTRFLIRERALLCDERGPWNTLPGPMHMRSLDQTQKK